MGENIFSWSKTAATNSGADSSINLAEGQAPGSVNNSMRALMATLAKLRDDINGTVTTGGTSTAYTATCNTAWGALSTGLLLKITLNATCGASPTLAVTDGGATALGAKKLRCFAAGVERDINATELLVGHSYDLRYDTAANSAAGAWVV